MSAAQRPPPHFEMAQETLEDGTLIITVSGELDLATAPMVGQRIRRPLFWEGVRRVVLDLSGLDFLDSSGASALLLSRSHARALARELVFVRPRSHVVRRLETYGLDLKLAMFETQQDALASLRREHI